MTSKDRASYGSSPPCNALRCHDVKMSPVTIPTSNISCHGRVTRRVVTIDFSSSLWPHESERKKTYEIQQVDFFFGFFWSRTGRVNVSCHGRVTRCEPSIAGSVIAYLDFFRWWEEGSGGGAMFIRGGGRDKGGGSDWFVSLRVCVVDEHVINKERIYSCTPMYTRNNMCGERTKGCWGRHGHVYIWSSYVRVCIWCLYISMSVYYTHNQVCIYIFLSKTLLQKIGLFCRISSLL